jgi:hypothetical protein
VHDKGTPGWSSGWSTVTSWPSHHGSARKFVMN